MKAALQEADEAEENGQGGDAIGEGTEVGTKRREVLSAEEKAKKEKERQKSVEVGSLLRDATKH
jgi:hypothetical protein